MPGLPYLSSLGGGFIFATVSLASAATTTLACDSSAGSGPIALEQADGDSDRRRVVPVIAPPHSPPRTSAHGSLRHPGLALAQRFSYPLQEPDQVATAVTWGVARNAARTLLPLQTSTLKALTTDCRKRHWPYPAVPPLRTCAGQKYSQARQA